MVPTAHEHVGQTNTRLPNKGMKLTKLSAAPTLAPQAALGRRCRRMPAPAELDAGTASQLIPGVRLTRSRRGQARSTGCRDEVHERAR
jgi:hypothetical protein